MGVAKNFAYNLTLTFCNYLFPLIVYPYISRVLGVNNIGICNYVDSVINYFILFSMLGVQSYGVREIARCKNDKNKLNNVFSSLLSINIIVTLCVVLCLIFATLYIPAFEEYRRFLFAGVLKVVFSAFLVEWLFQGLERFKYITTRSIVVRCIYVIFVFIFVKSSDDAFVYYLLTCFTIVLNALFNIFNSRKYAHYSIRQIKVKKYIGAISSFGIYRILISMYTTFNVFYLGIVAGTIEVGYFTTATKLYTIIMGAFSAFTLTMIPKVSSLIADKEWNKLQLICDKSIELLFILLIPIICICVIYAPEIIFIISGKGYEGAVNPFRIVIFLLGIIGLEQILISQFLMGANRSKSIVWISLAGAITGLGCNFFLTPSMLSMGSAMSWLLSELVVLLMGYYFIRRELLIKIRLNVVGYSVIKSVPVLIISIVCYYSFSTYYDLIVSCISSLLFFIYINLFKYKNETLIGILYRIPVINKLIRN